VDARIMLTGSDTDGQVAMYEADLDGNGTFETAQGTPIDLNRTYNNSTTIRGRVQDDDGDFSTTVSRSITVTQPPRNNVLRVRTQGANRNGNIEDLEGIHVIVRNSSSADTVQSDASGVATIPDLEDGTYTVEVRDELEDALGGWFDRAETHGVTSDKTITIPLFQNISLEPGDNFYRNALDWFNQVVTNLKVVGIGMPNNLQSPYRLWIDMSMAPSQQYVDDVKAGMQTWDWISFTDDENEKDYTVRFTNRSSVTRGQRLIKIRDDLSPTNRIRHGCHEISHVFMNTNEENETNEYASSLVCPPEQATQFEKGLFEILRGLKINFGEDVDMGLYEEN